MRDHTIKDPMEIWNKYGWRVCECGQYMVKGEDKETPAINSSSHIIHRAGEPGCEIRSVMAVADTEEGQRKIVINSLEHERAAMMAGRSFSNKTPDQIIAKISTLIEELRMAIGNGEK